MYYYVCVLYMIVLLLIINKYYLLCLLLLSLYCCMLLCVSVCLSSFLWRLRVDAVSLWMPQVRNIPKVLFWIRNKTNGGRLFRDFHTLVRESEIATAKKSPNQFFILKNDILTPLLTLKTIFI